MHKSKNNILKLSEILLNLIAFDFIEGIPHTRGDEPGSSLHRNEDIPYSPHTWG